MDKFQTPFYAKFWRINYENLSEKTYDIIWKPKKQVLLDCFEKQNSKDKKLTSPQFPEKKSAYKWDIDFYPTGDEEEGQTSIYINLISKISQPVSVLYYVAIQTSAGEIIAEQETTDIFAPTLKAWGYSNFVDSSILKTHVQACTNGDIEIRVLAHVDADQFIFSQSLNNNLAEFAENEDFKDIIISVGDKQYKAHRYILAARSKVFAELLYDEKCRKLKTNIEIKNVIPETLENLLQYINTGNIKNLDVESTKNLLKAAKTFHLDDLIFKCNYLLISRFDPKNIFDMLIFADEYEIEMLKTHVISYITKNFGHFTTAAPFKMLEKKKSCFLIDILVELAKEIKENTKSLETEI